ncbi:MAG TPA: autotransporter-associated beta strand repeat-containing protein [Candidatus Methylacidiphilales bacterium]
MKTRLSKPALLLLCLGLAHASGTAAHAATDTWNGSASDWNTVSGWTGALPTSADTALFGSGGNGNLAVGLAGAGAAKNLLFTSGAGAYTVGSTGGGTLSLAASGSISVDNLAAGAETVNAPLSLGGSATFSNTASSAAYTLTVGGNVSSAANGTLSLTGSNTGNNTVSGTLANGAGTLGLLKGGTGTWVLSGNNTYTGATSLQGGTLVLDYTTNTGSKLGTGSALAMGGATLQLVGGSGVQSVASTNFNGAGTAQIVRTSGTETVSLGAISFGVTSGNGSATSVNFQSGVATTTNTTTNTTNVSSTNLLGGGAFAVVGSQGAADWAAVDSTGTIVSFTTANTAGYIALAAGNTGNSGDQDLVTDSLTTTTAVSMNTLKIATTASTGNQTLTLGGALTLGVNGGILDSAISTGTYTITGGTITFGGTGASIQQYGNGVLEIDSTIYGGGGIYFQKSGPGTLVLTGNNAWKHTLAINGGAVSVGSDANLGGQIGTANVLSSSTTSTTVTLDAVPANLVIGSSFLGSTVTAISGTTVTLKGNANTTITSSTASVYSTEGAIILDGGTLEATGSFSLSESTAGTTVTRAISLGANGGTFQVDGGNTLTAPGVISNLSTGAPGGLTKTGTGTLVLTGANTYTGATLVAAGTLTLSGSLGTTAVTVANGATFGGSGTLATAGIPASLTVVSGGIVMVGDGTAATSLKVNGIVTLASGSVLKFVLGAGNTHSTLALGASTGSTLASGLVFDFVNIQAGTYSNLITGLAADPGTEAGWVLAAEDAGYAAVFSYSSGNISAVVTALAVPEPRTWAMLFAGLLFLLARVRVRARRSATL